MKKTLIMLITILVLKPLYANDLYTVINPTAGILGKGEARIHQKVFKHNGMIIGTDVGLFDNFYFGVAYGAEQVVGDQKPIWYNKVDFHARFRIINETLTTPAIAIGVDTHGNGAYYKSQRRYDYKSKGAYCVASKNFEFLGLIGFDFGFNYTFEGKNDNEESFDIFTGVYKTIGQSLVIFSDFSAGINDNDKNCDLSGRSRGYFNTGAQLKINEQLTIKLLMHDLFENKRNTNYFDRAIVIDYRWFF